MSSSDLLMMSAGGGGLPPSLRRGLVAWYDPWRQVNTTGEAQTLTDYSGHGNHGTLGATDSASTDDPAWTGNSLQFDGVDDIVNINGVHTGTEKSAVAVFRRTALTGGYALVNTKETARFTMTTNSSYIYDYIPSYIIAGTTTNPPEGYNIAVARASKTAHIVQFDRSDGVSVS